MSFAQMAIQSLLKSYFPGGLSIKIDQTAGEVQAFDGQQVKYKLSFAELEALINNNLQKPLST